MKLTKYKQLTKMGTSRYLLIPTDWLKEEELEKKDFFVTMVINGSSISVFSGKIRD